MAVVHHPDIVYYSAARLNIVNVKREDSYEAVFTALAHPARRRVLLAIYFQGGEMSAGECAAMFEHAWQTTTRHLQVLEAAGLVSVEKRGRMRIYKLERKRIALARDWLNTFFRKP
jgi:DNA-binding transcriptional ArsR family regulator